MESATPVCDLNETWNDITAEFGKYVETCSTWKCFSVDDVDKEAILSAPEIMDPLTDTGFGYENVCSLAEHFKRGEIPKPSEFADDQSLIDIMDYLHVRELHYLKGFSIVQSYLAFPYFLNLEALKDGNPVMYSYCRAMLCTLKSVLRSAFATTIRGDEEFVAAPLELDVHMSITLEEVSKELEELAEKASPAVAIRLRWRSSFVRALTLFHEAATREGVEEACDLCAEAAEWLESHPEFQRAAGDEPKMDARLIREKEVQFWVSVITPTKPLPQPPFKEVMEVYKTLLRQMASLKFLLTFPSLSSITDFIEDLGAQEPLLLVRCIAVITLFSRSYKESFLFGPPLQERLLETIAETYGAPLYLKVYQGNHALVESVVRYRIQKTMDPLKVTAEQVQSLRQQTVEAVRHWSAEACSHYLLRLEIMLCNRGLAHRRLLNALPGLAEFQELSYFVDTTIFVHHIPGGNINMDQEVVRASKVLSLWSNTLVLQAMNRIIYFQLELDLLKPGEIIPALWYLSTMNKAQVENVLLLSMQSSTKIPENRINKKRVPLYNLCLTTRSRSQLDLTEKTIQDLHRMLADAQLFAACIAEKKGLVDLQSTGSASLTTAENLFNHRYKKCFGMIQNPAFASYQHCMATKPRVKDETVHEDAKRASTLALNAAEKVHNHLQQVGRTLPEFRRRTLEKMECSARAIAACLAMMSDESTTAAEYECSLSFPGLPYFVSFAFHKKKAQA